MRTLVDARDSRVDWRTDVYGWAWNRIALTDHRLYLGVSGGDPYQMRHKGSLIALNRTTGKIAWRWRNARVAGRVAQRLHRVAGDRGEDVGDWRSGRILVRIFDRALTQYRRSCKTTLRINTGGSFGIPALLLRPHHPSTSSARVYRYRPL